MIQLEGTNCKNNCYYEKGHGHCIIADATCLCSPEWTGDDCGTPNPKGAYKMTTDVCKDQTDCTPPYGCDNEKGVCALKCYTGEYAVYDDIGWVGSRSETHRDGCKKCKWNRQTCTDPDKNLKNYCTGLTAVDNSNCSIPDTLYCDSDGKCYDDHNVALSIYYGGHNTKSDWKNPNDFCQNIDKYYKQTDTNTSYSLPKNTYVFHEQKLTHSDQCRSGSLRGDSVCGVDGSCCNNPTTASGKTIPPDPNNKSYNCYGVKSCDKWDTGYLDNSTAFYNTYMLKCQMDPDK